MTETKVSSRLDSKSDNLTGDQIQDVMDTMLYKALEPIVLYTDLFDNQIAHLLETLTRNKKRKLTLLPREEATDILVKVLIERDRVRKLELIRTLGLERSYVHIFIKRFVDLSRKKFLNTYFAFTTSSDSKSRERHRMMLNHYVQDFGAESRSQVFLCLTRSSECLDLYYKFVGSIVKEYEKLCSTSAKKHVDINSNNKFDFYDVQQGLMQNVVIALNKYNAEKGALTSHIKWWLFNAQTCNTSEHEYNIAYTVPQGQKKKMATHEDGQLNFSVSLDELIDGEESEGSSLHNLVSSDFNIEANIENTKSVEHIMKLSKHADPEGLARLSLDIGEHFSMDERHKMVHLMKNSGLL